VAARGGGADTAANRASAAGRPRQPRLQRRQRDNPDAYIAGDRRRALGDGRELPDRVSGAAIFADISGFTPLTEALARELGPQRGAEELTAALDVVFDAVLGELHRFGGSVIYFSGDAVTCWLEGDDGLRGVACALAMQRAMASVYRITTPGGTEVDLAMKVAVAAGPARRFVVGDPDIQLIDVLAGSLMDRLAAVEHHAERGEVLVDGATLHALEGRVEVSALRGTEDDRAAVVDSVATELGTLPPPLPYPKLSRAVVRLWLLPAVYERMRTGRGEFLSELRPAVPMFVRFGGIDYDEDEDAPGRLDDFIRRAQRLVDGHGGNVLQLTIGDKGAYLYAVFGSPLAHEDDAARACAAALDVLALEGETAATGLQVGIAKGRLRSGTYGHRQRRTFCCLGDAVNLAARLMSAAPQGQIYVTPEVAKGAASRFDFEELEAMTVKGKSAAVAVRRLLAHRDHRELRRLRALHPLVGREAELDQLVSLADDAMSGRGHLVGICAEAGMGKSSLAAVLAEVLEDRGVAVHVGAAASAGGGSYLVWQSIAASLFGLGGDETPVEIVARLEGALGEVDDSLLPRLPLLGPLVGVAIDDNELTSGFDAKLRKTSLESLVVQYLSRRAARAPFTIVLEDCHWIDPLSADLLALVARAAANLSVLVVATYRPGSFSAPALEHTTVLELDRLDESSCREVLVARLGDLYGRDRVPAGPLVDRLVARAEGNPFYLGELANYLHDQGADPADASAAQIELPSSLSSLVLSRLDILAEGARRTLKVASVVGRDFDVDILAGAYPTLGGTRQVLGQLRTLMAEDLVLAEDEVAHRFAFRHAVIQEVAYESLPFALRATVHGRVGVWLETADPGALDLLAHHFWHSREEAKKREYLRRAGDAAKARFANQAAADYYRRLFPLVDGAEREEVLGELGAALEIQGEWPEAVEVRREALALAEQRADPKALAWAQATLSTPLWKQGRYDEAGEALDVAERLFAEADDLVGMARVANARGAIALHTGAHDEAWAQFGRSLELRRSHGDRALLGPALTNLGVAAMDRGDYETAWSLTEESLALRVELGDRNKLSLPHNNLGMIAYLQGDFERAIPHLEESVRIATEIGSLWTVAMAQQNLGNCARERGDSRRARRHYASALNAFSIARDRRELSRVFQNVAMTVAPAQPEEAFRLLGAADAVREAMGGTRPEHEESELEQRLRSARTRLGDAATREGDAGRAMSLDAAIALCRELCAS
jgi:adenylate cyclase